MDYMSIVRPRIEELNITMQEMDLMSDIIAEVGELYELNDGAHKLDHAINVMLLGLELQMFVEQNYSEKFRLHIISAALLHDITVNKGRKDHHLTAVDLLTEEKYDFFQKLCSKYLIDSYYILLAISQHRASYDGHIDNMLSAVISAADRGRPDIKAWAQRLTKKYSSGTISEEDFEKDYQHTIDKKGRNGYAVFPQLYKDYFKEELEISYKQIEDKELFRKLYYNR